jgi:3-methyladenine DNA glycosylase AlkD
LKFSRMTELRSGLRKIADPGRAPRMQAYMKSAMPYYGISSPALQGFCREFFRNLAFRNAAEWRGEVLGLWRNARFREERYVAVALTEHRAAREFQVPAALPMYEEMIVTGAWWDYVDALAANRVGPILRAYPGPMKRKMLAWSRSPDLWKRRTSIICQLGSKDQTDLKLLYACIEPSLGSREFFLRKAIGWALRQLAWSDPREVKRYVAAQGDRLSPLSRREALKNL